MPLHFRAPVDQLRSQFRDNFKFRLSTYVVQGRLVNRIDSRVPGIPMRAPSGNRGSIPVGGAKRPGRHGARAEKNTCRKPAQKRLLERGNTKIRQQKNVSFRIMRRSLSKAPKAHRKSKMQKFVISSHPLNGAGHMGPGLRPDFWQVEKHDVKASAMPSLKCNFE